MLSYYVVSSRRKSVSAPSTKSGASNLILPMNHSEDSAPDRSTLDAIRHCHLSRVGPSPMLPCLWLDDPLITHLVDSGVTAMDALASWDDVAAWTPRSRNRPFGGGTEESSLLLA